MTDEYTKGCCPCHRCKKIVAELKTMLDIQTCGNEQGQALIKLHKSTILALVESSNVSDATISRLRELLSKYQYAPRFQDSLKIQACACCFQKRGNECDDDCELKQEITEAEK